MEQREINQTIVKGRKFNNPINIRLLVGLRQIDLPFRRAIPANTIKNLVGGSLWQ